MSRKILSLCDYSGRWSQPYADAGYEVIRVDLKLGQDVRFLVHPGPVHGILAAPPCTHLAASGARWWQQKGPEALAERLALVDACLRLVTVCQPEWWALENPIGRLRTYLGAPKLYFHPCEYAGYLKDPKEDAYTKKTCLWGSFDWPRPEPVIPTQGSKMWANYGGKSEATKTARSLTPRGFAQAFFEANP